MADQQVHDAVRAMIGARRSADYYITVFRDAKKHVEFAQAAQREYRKADSRLQELGVSDNQMRQFIIHGIAAEGV
jgi:hypothetical protein